MDLKCCHDVSAKHHTCVTLESVWTTQWTNHPGSRVDLNENQVTIVTLTQIQHILKWITFSFPEHTLLTLQLLSILIHYILKRMYVSVTDRYLYILSNFVLININPTVSTAWQCSGSTQHIYIAFFRAKLSWGNQCLTSYIRFKPAPLFSSARVIKVKWSREMKSDCFFFLKHTALRTLVTKGGTSFQCNPIIFVRPSRSQPAVVYKRDKIERSIKCILTTTH